MTSDTRSGGRSPILRRVSERPEPTGEERRQRNVLIAAAGGAFVLPLAGVIGATLFYVRGDERSAWIVFGAAIAGAVVYGALLALAG